METFSRWDALLPSFIDTPWLVWIQWSYAAWQLLRKNALAILVVSLPFHWILKGRKTIVILGSDRDYDRTRDEYMQHMKGRTKLYDVHILRFHEQWAKVEYKERFYIVHQNALFAYLALMQDIDGDIVFATERKDITDDLVVAKKLSYDEGIESIFLRKGHCGMAPHNTVLTSLDSEEINTKVWAVLSLVPLWLHLYNYSRLSNLLSILIILLDMNKSWVHKLGVSFEIIKWVKLNVFKHRSYLYTLFGMFSSRWNYCDPNKKMAYYINPGETVLIKDFCKFKNEDDFRFCDANLVFLQERVGNKYDGCMQIDMNKAHYVWRQYNNRYLRLITNIRLFVSDGSIKVNRSMMLNGEEETGI